VIEFSERLSYFGIATSLMIYLTKVLQEEMKVAAKNANYWMSVTTLMPLLGGFLADGYLGRFSTVVVSTAVYLLVRGLTNIVYMHGAHEIDNRSAGGSQHLISCGV
jgi:dipeptide/tripeptide permease